MGPSSRPRRRPRGRGWWFHPCQAAPAAILLSALLAPPAALAGPVTTLLKGVAIEGAQATFNNSWGQSVMATGDTVSTTGEASIHPFAPGSTEPPTAAPSTYLHAVLELVPNEAKARVTAISGYTNRAGREDGQGANPGITAFSGEANGLNSLGLQARPGPDPETISGQVDGQNIGTQSLSVFGRVDEIPVRQSTVVSWF